MALFTSFAGFGRGAYGY